MPKRKAATKKSIKSMAEDVGQPVAEEVAVEGTSAAAVKKPRKESSKKDKAERTGTKPVFKGEESTTTDGRKWNLKISSWNVAGARAWIKKDGLNFVKKESPDVLVMEETKCAPGKLPPELSKVDGYHGYFHAGEKEGYAGIGLLSKVKPINVKFGIDNKEHDKEARVVAAEFDDYYVVGAYVPNSSRGLTRLPYRRRWNIDFLKFIKDLDAKKPVIYTGDLNVAHQETDLANPDSNRNKTAGFTDQEREDFTTLLNAGFIDSFRKLYPDAIDTYSFWSYMANARAKNVGWRLDYFVLSERLGKDLCDSVMQTEYMGSDHCPVALYMAME